MTSLAGTKSRDRRDNYISVRCRLESSPLNYLLDSAYSPANENTLLWLFHGRIWPLFNEIQPASIILCIIFSARHKLAYPLPLKMH